MGPGETIGLVAVAGVLIGVLVVAGESFKHWVAYKKRKVELDAEALRGGHAEMVEERLRVLERIATDRGLDLAHEIEGLRDRQVRPPLGPGSRVQ